MLIDGMAWPLISCYKIKAWKEYYEQLIFPSAKSISCKLYLIKRRLLVRIQPHLYKHVKKIKINKVSSLEKYEK